MIHSKLYTLSFINILWLCSMSAMAHTGMNESIGLMAGLEHPLSGIDHILAMVAVGFLASQIGGYALWAMPIAFIIVMTFGGILGALQFSVPLIESGIIASVLILGIIIASSMRFSIPVSILIVGFFAIFHGFAHGMEMSIHYHAVAYSAGFAFTTAMLHGIGILMGIWLQQLHFYNVQRWVGGLITLGGIYLVIT